MCRLGAQGTSQRLSWFPCRQRKCSAPVSINMPPGKCRYHFSNMPIAREKQICTRDSTFLSEVPTSNFILHTYMLIQQVLLFLVLRKCFQLPFLEGLLCPGEDVLLPQLACFPALALEAEAFVILYSVLCLSVSPQPTRAHPQCSSLSRWLALTPTVTALCCV